MPHAAIPLLSQYLRRLTARYGDPATDHELLQRFVVCRDESAFAALVERHAAMVLGLSRSILRNHHDAEDIFQATFLVLARKAGSIRKRESVGSWLYAVAHRLAHKARARAEKQRRCEQQAAIPPEQTPMDAVTWGELRDILHEEVSRLPEKYRAAVVVCYWQGRTHEQAGQQLGCARGTIKDRLEKARELLRKRLARRGLALSAAWFAASLSEGTAATVSAELVQATVRGAMLFSIGELPAGMVSANALACAKSALQSMLHSKLKFGLALVLMLGVLGGGAGLVALREVPTPTAPEVPPKAAQAAPVPAKEQEHVDRLGDPLPPGALLRLGTIRFRPGGGVQSLAFLPGGDTIVSTGFKGIYFWDVATGKERRRIKLSDEWVGPFALSADGKIVASAGRESIQLWEVSTGKELHTLKTKATCLAFSRDGRRLASVDQENTVVLWDWRKQKEERRIPTKQMRISKVGFGPDDRSMYAWDDQKLLAWDVGSGRPLAGLPYPTNRCIKK